MDAPSQYATLGAVSKRLEQLGIQVTSDEIRVLAVTGKTATLRNALAQATENPSAHAYLVNAIAHVRLPPTANGAEANASLPPPPTLAGRASTPPVRPSLPNTNMAMVHTMDQVKRYPPSVAATGTPARNVSAPLGASAQREHGEFHIYGGKGALTLSPGENKKQKAVVFIDAAMATGPRVYDWDNKIVTMLTPDEVLITLAVALGSSASAKFNNHGEAKDKWIEIVNQGANLFFKVGQGKHLCAIPIGPADAYKLAALLTAQVRKNTPEGARVDVRELVTGTVGKMLSAIPRQAAGAN